MDRVAKRLYHNMFGIHSGIPPCCVAAFNKDLFENGIRKVSVERYKKHNIPFNNDFGYVPCDKCCKLIKEGTIKPAKIHDCSPDQESCREFRKLSILFCNYDPFGYEYEWRRT